LGQGRVGDGEVKRGQVGKTLRRWSGQAHRGRRGGRGERCQEETQSSGLGTRQ
jgi:hypothetical protein